MPVLSIIVPLYNVEKYLPRCVASIISQDFKDFEVILVDDGSTDNSACICDKIVAEDKRFRVIHKYNEGPSSARNAGLDAAAGKYIGFVDGDDAISPTFYSTLIDGANRHNADVVMCGYTRMNIDGTTYQFPEHNRCPQSRVLEWREFMDYCLLPFFGYANAHRLPSPFTSCCDKLYRKAFIADIHFKSERLVVLEDNLFNLLVFDKLPRFVFEATYGYCYYEIRSSRTSNYSIKQLSGFLNLGLEMRKIGAKLEPGQPIRQYVGAWIFYICTSLFLANKPIVHFAELKSLMNSSTFQDLLANCPKRSSWPEQAMLESLRKPRPVFAWVLIVAYSLIKKWLPRFRIRPSYLARANTKAD